DSRSLVASERGQETHRAISIHPDRTRFQALRHRERATHAGGPASSGQAINRIVGGADGFSFCVKRYHGEDRSENFFLRDSHRGVDARENGWLDKPSRAAFRTFRRSATQ